MCAPGDLAAGRAPIADIENQGCFTQNKQATGLVHDPPGVQRRTKAACPRPRRHPVRPLARRPDLIGAWVAFRTPT